MRPRPARVMRVSESRRASTRVGDEEIDLLVKSEWGRLVVEFKGSAATASVRGAIEQVRRLASAPHEVLGSRVQHAMTGLAGAWLLTKFASFRIATTFLTEPPSKRLLSDLGFREEPRGANTWLVLPNDDGVFDGQEKIDGVACAHPAQDFLDLAGHPERAKEAADEVRKRKLRWTPR